MIYDIFLFNDELEILDLRLNILDPHVDRFILTDANRTFSGLAKTSKYHENLGLFAKFEGRIIHNFCEVPSSIQNPWAVEKFCRDSAGLLNIFTDNDLLLSSDVDEIPNPKILEERDLWCRDDRYFICLQNRYLYYLNNYQSPNWKGTRACTYRYLKQSSLNKIRRNRGKERGKPDPNFILLSDGGWHFTFCGGKDRVDHKIKSFSHQEFNSPEYFLQIEERMAEGCDPFGRDTEPKTYTVPINDSFPAYIGENQHALSALIKK